MSFRETESLLKTYYTKQEEEYKSDREEKRWLAFIIAVSSGLEVNGKKVTKPSDLRKYSWDMEEVVNIEYRKKAQEELLKIMERI